MILGVAHAEAWIGAELRRGPEGAPQFVNTAFGWTAVGGGGGNGNNITCHATVVEKESLHRDFQKIFEHDFKAVSEIEVGQSVENKEAIRQLEQTIRFDQSKGKYV